MRNRPEVVRLMILILAAQGCATSRGAVMVPRAADGSTAPAGIPGWSVSFLAKDQELVLSLRDGTTAKGRFRGLAEVAEKEYAQRYARSSLVARPEIALPKLGPGLRVAGRSGAEETWTLLGFEPGSLRLGPGHGVKASTSLELEKVSRVTDAGQNVADGAALARLAAAGRLPFLSEIRIDDGVKERRVPLESVSQLELGKSKSGGSGWKTAGAVVAAVAVAALAIAALAAAGEDKPPPPQEIQVCSPLVSSHDGERYVADADIFGGALHPRAKRTDWSVLAHLREAGGRYRLRIDKTHAETEYVDELTLLAVDHPRGTRVLADATGGLHVLAASAAGPLRAKAHDGSDVTTLVAQDDARAWISNPFGRDPRDAGQVRDGLTLEFARPRAAQTVTLALRAQNTGWAFHLRHAFLELLGKDVDRWYGAMEASPESYRAFEEAREREIALRVSLWDGAGWREAGVVGEVGSEIPKDLALTVDLRGVPGERLHLRLDSTAGLWVVEHVRADFTAAAPAQPIELTPASVFEQGGRDVTPALVATDGRIYEMTDSSQWAEAVFDAPPRAGDSARTLVLRSNGHYRIHLHREGEAQWSVVERLIREPGAFGRFALERLLVERQRLVRTAAAGG